MLVLMTFLEVFYAYIRMELGLGVVSKSSTKLYTRYSIDNLLFQAMTETNFYKYPMRVGSLKDALS